MKHRHLVIDSLCSLRVLALVAVLSFAGSSVAVAGGRALADGEWDEGAWQPFIEILATQLQAEEAAPAGGEALSRNFLANSEVWTEKEEAAVYASRYGTPLLGQGSVFPVLHQLYSSLRQDLKLPAGEAREADFDYAQAISERLARLQRLEWQNAALRKQVFNPYVMGVLQALAQNQKANYQIFFDYYHRASHR